MASCVAVLFGDKIRSQSKPFLYLFQLVAAKDPVHESSITMSYQQLTEGQRYQLSVLRAQGMSILATARAIGVHRSTL
ncbi:helix-turn-helix domain-containing protein, partial [Aeromonas caviae]|uniref:helix-turn-helix domain-containing protein n=1 Tax=Aeromonas caviae TaxID=648 RepID=UPI0020B111F5